MVLRGHAQGSSRQDNRDVPWAGFGHPDRAPRARRRNELTHGPDAHRLLGQASHPKGIYGHEDDQPEDDRRQAELEVPGMRGASLQRRDPGRTSLGGGAEWRKRQVHKPGTPT